MVFLFHFIKALPSAKKLQESEAVPDLVAHLVLLLPPPPPPTPPIRLSMMSIKRQTGEAFASIVPVGCFDPAGTIGTKPVDESTILGLKRVRKLSGHHQRPRRGT